MFDDRRSKSVIFVAHCLLNQNSISDGTASYKSCLKEMIDLIYLNDTGIIQLPCPELMCIGLDRGDSGGAQRPVTVENTRIREQLNKKSSQLKIQQMAEDMIHQIREYIKFGFDVKGIIGINRSPSCGVETTSINNIEAAGQGVFMQALKNELQKKDIALEFIGIKAEDMARSKEKILELVK